MYIIKFICLKNIYNLKNKNYREKINYTNTTQQNVQTNNIVLYCNIYLEKTFFSTIIISWTLISWNDIWHEIKIIVIKIGFAHSL